MRRNITPNAANNSARLFSAVCAVMCAALVCSCAVTRKSPLVIWTDRAEFVSSVELFNASQDKVKAIAVYKRSPARLFPPPKGEAAPDIIIAPGLKNQQTQSRFLPLDRLFAAKKINRDDFYANLLSYGTIGGKTYLLPVSFNLPAVIFDSANESLIPQEHLISLGQIRETSAAFNAQMGGRFVSMGFGPSWEKPFLYLSAKLLGARFRGGGLDAIEWDDEALQNAVQFLRDWTLAANTSAAAEEDFAFKYLYMAPERQVVSGRCLFAYTPSSVLFMISGDLKDSINFRWVYENVQIPVDDDCVYFAVNKKSKNTAASRFFASWFFQEETQRALLEHSSAMRPDTAVFGIAGGFSGLRRVTERVFPAYYPLLLGNIPPADYLTAPDMLPPQWLDICREVVIPYLAAACGTKSSAARPLSELIAEWQAR